jgi:hypothetical protein
MSLSNVDHFFDSLEVPPFFGQSLPHLKIVDCICKLSDNSENMLFDEVAQEICFFGGACMQEFPGNEGGKATEGLKELIPIF